MQEKKQVLIRDRTLTVNYLNELEHSANRLRSYIQSPDFEELDLANKQLLLSQFNSMKLAVDHLSNHLNILRLRISEMEKE